MKVLFTTVVGSRLYGTNKADSDFDIKGFCLPDISNLFGLEKFEQHEFNYPTDKLEGTIYSLTKFIRLCLSGNPTVIEVAFADPRFHRVTTRVGEEVCQFVRDNFLTKDLFPAYMGYHKAQVRKLYNLDKTGKRVELIEKYGYDVKHAAHAYRLAVQAIDIMDGRGLNPTLTDNNLLICRDILSGKFSLEDCRKVLDNCGEMMYNAYEKSVIPDKPDFDKVNRFLVETYKDEFVNGT